MAIQHYANKETRDRLRNKSIAVYASSGMWKKVMNRLGLDVVEIEKVLDGIIEKVYGSQNAGEEIRSTEAGHESNTEQGGDGPSKGDDLREE